MTYKVRASRGLIVRKQPSLLSPVVSMLYLGDEIKVSECMGNRARILSPVEGWITLRTSVHDNLERMEDSNMYDPVVVPRQNSFAIRFPRFPEDGDHLTLCIGEADDTQPKMFCWRRKILVERGGKAIPGRVVRQTQLVISGLEEFSTYQLQYAILRDNEWQ